MSRSTTVVLMYHHHKLLDLNYETSSSHYHQASWEYPLDVNTTCGHATLRINWWRQRVFPKHWLLTPSLHNWWPTKLHCIQSPWKLQIIYLMRNCKKFNLVLTLNNYNGKLKLLVEWYLMFPALSGDFQLIIYSTFINYSALPFNIVQHKMF
jgi:hypothetical protein